MRIIVIGASRLGIAVVQELLDCEHDVVLVDQARARLDDVSERLDCGFIEGDGTLPQTLRDAFGDGADALMLMTNQDDVNILGAVVGRSIGYDRIVLQIVRSELLQICEELGFDDVVTPHATVAASIVGSIENKEQVWSELSVVDGVHFAAYAVPAALIGTDLGALEMPDGTRAVAISRNGEEAILDAGAEMQEGDEVLVAAVADTRDALHALFETEN